MAWLPISGATPQFEDSNGTPYSGAVLKFYRAGTSTVINLATDSTGGTQVDDVALNASGFPEVSGNVVIPHLEEDYKIALYPSQSAADSDSGAVWTIDNIAIGSPANQQYIDSGVTPVFASSTSFTIENSDSTDVFHIGRRLKLTDSGGTDYATITNSSYSAPDTTVTVSVDGGGSLDAGLSAVDISILTATNSAVPSVSISGTTWTFDGDINTNGNNILFDDATGINDSSDNKQVRFQETASAVNQIDVTNAATGNAPSISATGDDTNIDLELSSKGTGLVRANGQNVVINSLSEVATTSGTSHDFTIPSGAKRVKLHLVGVSLNGNVALAVRLGDSGGVENSGYNGASAQLFGGTPTASAYSSQFVTNSASSAAVYHGTLTFELQDSSDFTWTINGALGRSDTPAIDLFAGSKSLTAELTTVQILSANGVATFDAGVANITWE